jgi:hypothetical protein
MLQKNEASRTINNMKMKLLIFLLVFLLMNFGILSANNRNDGGYNSL